MVTNSIVIAVDFVTHHVAIAEVFTPDFGMILFFFMRRRDIIPLSYPRLFILSPFHIFLFPSFPGSYYSLHFYISSAL